MHQTICQKCGAANHADAIVCLRCGVKLAHPEWSVGARMKKSGLFRSLVSAPGRLLKWTFKKIITIVLAALFLTVFCCGLLYFLLFVPLSWEQAPMPQPVSSENKDFKRQLQIMKQTGGTLSAEPLLIRQLGNALIFDPSPGAIRKKNAPPPRTPDINKGYFSFIKLPHDQFSMILFQKFDNKLPFRLQAVFIARREKNGLLELEKCRLGNLPVPAFVLRMAAEKMLTQWNPDQQFLAVFDRITKGEMQLQSNGQENKITMQIQAAKR